MRISVLIKLDRADLDAIDAARGSQPRMGWIIDACMAKVSATKDQGRGETRAPVAPKRALGQRDAPVVADLGRRVGRVQPNKRPAVVRPSGSGRLIGFDPVTGKPIYGR